MGAGLVAHTIKANNEEYDAIIVNMSYKYKAYYREVQEANKQKESLGQKTEQPLDFSKWLESQGITEKEKKAIKRYQRINMAGSR